MTQSYPLHWPIGWPRTEPWKRKRANFSSQFSKEVSQILNGIKLLCNVHYVSATRTIISTNQSLRKDGLPYATYQKIDDPGVAVYFMKDGKQVCIPCDKWDKIQDNLRAINKTIEAIRGIERWGAKETVDAAFRGFESLPPGTGVTEGVSTQEIDYFFGFISAEAIKLRYRDLVKKMHPDVGGDAESFSKMQQQYEKKLRGE